MRTTLAIDDDVLMASPNLRAKGWCLIPRRLFIAMVSCSCLSGLGQVTPHLSLSTGFAMRRHKHGAFARC
jgi:hypothetical protein